jgi:hypothetical protein
LKAIQWWLSLVFGTLSIVMLAKEGFSVSFVSALQAVLDFYEQALQALFGWAEPWIRHCLVLTRRWLGELDLHSHWKHVVVLLGVYFGADARTSLGFGNYGSAAYRFLIGMMIAVAAGVAAGTFPASTAGSIGIAFAAMAGIALYDLLECTWQAIWFRQPTETWWIAFRPRLIDLVARTVFGVALVLLALQLPIVRRLPNPGVAALGIYALAIAVWWMWWGARHVASNRSPDDSWTTALFRRAGTRVGIAMLTAFAGAAVFIATNAGLKFAGM